MGKPLTRLFIVAILKGASMALVLTANANPGTAAWVDESTLAVTPIALNTTSSALPFDYTSNTFVPLFSADLTVPDTGNYLIRASFCGSAKLTVAGASVNLTNRDFGFQVFKNGSSFAGSPFTTIYTLADVLLPLGTGVLVTIQGVVEFDAALVAGDAINVYAGFVQAQSGTSTVAVNDSTCSFLTISKIQ